jgi:hypothetical protein
VRLHPGVNSFWLSITVVNPLRIYTMLAAAAASATVGCLAVESAAPDGGKPGGGGPPGSVSVVRVSPPTGTIPVGQTQQFSATPQDSAGHPLTGLTVTWMSSDARVATVTSSGLVSGVDSGSVTISATSAGKTGRAAVAVLRPPPPGSPDPALLPRAALQAPDVAAYAALDLPGRSAGFSYKDPVSGVKIWKVTSGSVPAANSGAGHDYGEGSNQVSRGWGVNGNTHTLLIRGAGMSYHLVDFARGVGFINYRRLTGISIRDIAFTFSSVAGQERIAYAIDQRTGQLHRYNTATMQVEDIGSFPATLNTAAPATMTWLQQDKNDGWFVGLWDGSTAFAWNSRTNQLLTHGESWLNEPRLERDGRFVGLTGGGDGPVRLWDLANNSLGPEQYIDQISYFSHLASCRGMWVTTDARRTAAPFAQDRYDVSNGRLVETQILANSATAVASDAAGNWIQSDAELGGSLKRQWAYLTGTGVKPWSHLLLWNQAIGVQRGDGSDQRLLLHHYSTGTSYWDDPWGTPSPDGKVVIFNSNMNGSGRYDLFVAEVPLR